MAITILQEPLIPDMSNKDLIYLVSSNQTSQPQFQYVCDIKEADGTLIQRIKQQPSPTGKAVFNIGQIITNNLAFDPTLIKTEPSDNTGNNNNIFSANTLERWADDFIIAFGEEYGTSVSSSVTLYGPSTVSSTHPTSSFFAGTKDFNELPNSYSWISGSLPRQDQADYENNKTLGFADARKFYNAVEVESGSGAGVFELDGLWLTNYPNEEGVDKYGFGSDFTATNPTRKVYKIRKKDFLTLSFINGNFDYNNQYAQDIAGIGLYNKTTSGTAAPQGYCFVLNSSAYGGGPRTATNTTGWGSAAQIRWQNFNGNGKQTIESQFMTINVGYNQINGHNATKASDGTEVAYDIVYTGSEGALLVEGTGYGSSYFGSDRKTWGSAIIQYLDDCNYYDTVRFAWKNEFGAWDWYTATLAEEATSNVERLSFEREVINYSSNNQVSFNSSGRGTKNYMNKITRNRVVNTDWLTDAEAQWLRELFFSTEVFIQDYDNNRILPVTITNASVTEKTNPRSQKLFQYRIEFKMANDLTARQG